MEVEVNHHDDQPPILDNIGAGAQPEPAVVFDDNVKLKLLDAVVMADWDEAERTLSDIDGFVKQLKGAEDDLLMEDSENIPMLPGPDPFTENYLLC